MQLLQHERHVSLRHCHRFVRTFRYSSTWPRIRFVPPPGSVPPEAAGLKAEPWSGTYPQQKALNELHTRMEAKGMRVDEETLKWFLRDRYFNVQEADQKLARCLRWRHEYQHVSAASVSRELTSGKGYVHTSPDKYGRPAIVIRTRRHVVGEYPIEDSKRLCVHLIDKAVAEAVAAGGEQVLGIFDLRGFQVPQNADLVFAAFLIEVFFEYYPRRLAQVLFVDAPWVFQPLWMAVKPLMRKYSALVRFVTIEELRREYFMPHTLPPDFK